MPLSPPDEADESAALYLSILRDFPALIWRSDTEARCDWFNVAWLEFRGRTIEEEYGDGWAEGVHSDDLERCVEVWQRNFEARTPFEMEYRLRRHDGAYRWIRDFGRPFFRPDGRFLGFIGACYDITDLKEMTEELERLASHDHLTGIPNRRAFAAEVDRAIALAQRGRASVVLFADVDGFKTVNDRFGHETGDEVLCEIATALRAVVRRGETVARIGGDEFGCVLWEQSPERAENAMRRLRDTVRRVGRSRGVELDLSIGAAQVTSDSTVSRIMADADARMYAAKDSGSAA